MYDIYGLQKKKRTIGIRDKQILLYRARHKCESCNRKIDFSEMHVGHKRAASKGGSATLRNSVCLCARCNKLQGTDSWFIFMKKMGKESVKSITSPARNKKVYRKKRGKSVLDLAFEPYKKSMVDLKKYSKF